MKNQCRERGQGLFGGRITLIVRPGTSLHAERMGATLFLNPADDEAFVRRVNELVAAGIAEATEFETRLRAWYPHAVVRPRDLANERINTWYVYRDGHWVATD
jgi:hypothetical protein